MLNADQLAAVREDGHTLVVALPGSGKTHLSVSKIARLLDINNGQQIGAVTFTRDSASELTERILREVGKEKAKRVLTGTFHSHSIKLLQQARELPTILAPAQQYALVERSIRAANLDLSIMDAIQVIEHVKCSPDLEADSLDEERLFKAYQKILDSQGLCDMQDLLRLSLAGMQSGRVPPMKVSHLLVDEFQDTDEVQLAWVMEHANQGTIITVVGDDDQSIYGWRRALGFHGMTRFAKETGARVITLSSNYRCRQEVLQRAETLIKRNVERVEKTMLAEKGAGGSIEVIATNSRLDEATLIAKRILDDPVCFQKGELVGVPKGSWAILARNNHLLRLIAGELQAHNIDYRLGSGKNLWEVPPLLHLAGMLKSIADNSLLGVDLALGWTGVSEEGIERIHRVADGRVARLTSTTIDVEGLEKDEAEKLTLFRQLFKGWVTQLQQGRLSLGINAVGQWMKNHCDFKQRGEIDYGVTLLSQRLNGTLAERLKVVTRSQKKQDEDLEKVYLMTMHGSKGLEFDNVWLPAVEENVIPSSSKNGFSPRDEERRLMYVAITRAKSRLYITYVPANKPSPFINEAGLTLPKVVHTA